MSVNNVSNLINITKAIVNDPQKFEVIEDNEFNQETQLIVDQLVVLTNKSADREQLKQLAEASMNSADQALKTASNLILATIKVCY